MKLARQDTTMREAVFRSCTTDRECEMFMTGFAEALDAEYKAGMEAAAVVLKNIEKKYAEDNPLMAAIWQIAADAIRAAIAEEQKAQAKREVPR